MRIAFVASNPSHAGPESPAKKNFYKWVCAMDVKHGMLFFNVSNAPTPDNRPLKKSEYELDRLRRDLYGFDRIVALGSTAADALDKLGIQYFRLPHPSPKNRVLNDKRYIDQLLFECKAYLEGGC